MGCLANFDGLCVCLSPGRSYRTKNLQWMLGRLQFAVMQNAPLAGKL